MKNKSKFLINLIDNIFLLIIILSLLQIFIEDFFIYTKCTQDLINQIKFINIFFDLIFTIEFLIKLFYFLLKRKLGVYLFYEKGWIDFIASIPLLILISLPFYLNQIFDVNISYFWFFSIPESFRILRFLRILKFVNKIKSKTNFMLQRHISSISITVILSIIIFFAIIYFFQERNILLRIFDNLNEIAFFNIIIFLMILFVLSGILIFYRRHFKYMIFQPLIEMLKGFEEIYYTKEVKIPKNYSKDEIFNLAINFNKRWIPAKIRKLKEIKSRGLTTIDLHKKGNK